MKTTFQNHTKISCIRCIGLGFLIDWNNPEGADVCDMCNGTGENNGYRRTKSIEGKTMGSKTGNKRRYKRL